MYQCILKLEILYPSKREVEDGDKDCSARGYSPAPGKGANIFYFYHSTTLPVVAVNLKGPWLDVFLKGAY